ncbi:MAG: flagellar type III secretion system pore protein FliP [Pirellulaceae bacterium]
MDLLFIAQTTAQSTAQAIEGGKESGILSDLTAPMQIALLLGALSFATAMLVCVTAFTRIIIVLSFVRRALSTQEIPPNQVLLGLSIFLTMFVMAPTFEAIHKNAITPLLEANQRAAETQSEPEFTLDDAWTVTSSELKVFMMNNTRTDDLALFFELSETPPPSQRIDTPLKIMVPAFIISELKTAFIMGFCIYIPFLLIDLVVSTILMALGMMMMPPVVVSTPCKLLLFILVDGWGLITRALVSSFSVV